MSELITTSNPELIANAEIVVDSFCRNCGRTVATNDNYCGRCGNGCRDLINVAVPSATNSSSGLQTLDGVLKNRFAIFGLIATFGPLGIIALWLSPSFSSPTKAAWTLGYLFVAVVLPISIMIYWMNFSVQPLVEVLGN